MAKIQTTPPTETSSRPTPVKENGADSSGQNPCGYMNATSKVQVLRISNVRNWHFERVVFPGQRLVFEAPPFALLEVHTGVQAGAILADKIPCDRLRFNPDTFSDSAQAQRKEIAPCR